MTKIWLNVTKIWHKCDKNLAKIWRKFGKNATLFLLENIGQCQQILITGWLLFCTCSNLANNVFNWAILGLFLLIFVFLIQLTMTGFELWISVVGSDRQTNWATTTALRQWCYYYFVQKPIIFCLNFFKIFCSVQKLFHIFVESYVWPRQVNSKK